ncbi:transposable element Tc1 transposase [Trichonephila clavipes]|nr:transposable element Tc1 transposase [Trichonephila clavipes]
MVTSARDGRHLLRMAVNDHTASSSQLAKRSSTATGVLMSASSIRRRLLRRGLRARVPLYRIPPHGKPSTAASAMGSRAQSQQADWLQVVFSDESLFNLWNHDGCIRVRRYAGERCLPECVIERNSGLTTGVMVWDAISYHGRPNLLRIEGNLNSNRYVREVHNAPKSFPSFKASLELSLSRIMHTHM